MQAESVIVLPTLRVASVTCVVPVITSIPSVCLVIAIAMDPRVSRATQRDNVSVVTILMERIVTSARKDSTITPLVKSATAILLVWSPVSVVVDQYPRVNCVNARAESQDEFVTSANHCTGI